jgi:hypothetical protein
MRPVLPSTGLKRISQYPLLSNLENDMTTETIEVRIGGMTPGHLEIPAGSRFSPVPDGIKTFTGRTLIWAEPNKNSGSIIIIDKDTVEIGGTQHKLLHPLKLNMTNRYCIWINGTQPQP